MIIPGVQYPHWKAPSSRNACWIGVSRPSTASPSMVVIDRPTTSPTGVRQARTAIPSTSSLQAPQTPSPQPYLVPVSPHSSRTTSSRDRDGSSRTDRSMPLTRSVAVGGRSRALSSSTIGPPNPEVVIE
jgi:hypothetical protein